MLINDKRIKAQLMKVLRVENCLLAFEYVRYIKVVVRKLKDFHESFISELNSKSQCRVNAELPQTPKVTSGDRYLLLSKLWSDSLKQVLNGKPVKA